jgi:Na+/H+ antiporter NhaD/arsenite permease-like protein
MDLFNAIWEKLLLSYGIYSIVNANHLIGVLLIVLSCFYFNGGNNNE